MDIDNLKKENEKLKAQLNIIKDAEDYFYKVMQDAEDYENSWKQRKKELDIEITSLEKEANDKRKEIVELDDVVLLQDYGLYSPIYDFAHIDEYKIRLDDIRERQKEMIRNKTAAVCYTTWTVDGSKSKGDAFTNQHIKQIIRCFNDECDVLVSKVKFNNILVYIEKMRKSFSVLNQINTRSCVNLTTDYLALKIEELQLAYEYAHKKNEEKERLREEREILREEVRVQKEIEEKRKELEKEKAHYNNWLEKINIQLGKCNESSEKTSLLEKKLDFEKQIEQIDNAIKDVDYRNANKRAGYVYIISNIGSFGENIFKIGMTRRLDPTERIAELGGASVPFKFDIHAIMFSDDAPALETALHHKFRDKMVNMVNNRKEFFHVTLDEIKTVVKEHYDKTVDFINMPIAEQYRETINLRKIRGDEY